MKTDLFMFVSTWVAIASGTALFWGVIAALFKPPVGVVGGVALGVFAMVFITGCMLRSSGLADDKRGLR